jgi:hypothetical protein
MQRRSAPLWGALFPAAEKITLQHAAMAVQEFPRNCLDSLMIEMRFENHDLVQKLWYMNLNSSEEILNLTSLHPNLLFLNACT